MNDKIKVGYCVAYDWYLLKDSIPLIYANADTICLSVDKNRISWSGYTYKFDSAEFYKMIESLDKSNKITIVEESYFIPGLTPMQNEVRQRTLIAHHLGPGGWHIQLDCDEYFVGFDKFAKFLLKLPASVTHQANICCPWVTVYKKIPDGFLFIDPLNKKGLEFMQIAMQNPIYTNSRRNGRFNILTNYKILHQSWAREEHEVRDKLNNWGHSQDLNKSAYLERWKALSGDNFTQFRNLHPLVPSLWPALKFVEGKGISDLVNNFMKQKFPKLSALDLLLKNSRSISRLRKLINWN